MRPRSIAVSFASTLFALTLVGISSCSGGGSSNTPVVNNGPDTPIDSVNDLEIVSEGAAYADLVAWVGIDDAELSISENANGYQLYTSTDSDCPIANYATCSNASLHSLAGEALLDSAITLGSPAYVVAANDTSRTISKRIPSDEVNLSGEILFLFQDEVWALSDRKLVSSKDGVIWQQRGDAPPFFQNHQIVELDGHLIAVGDSGYGGYQNSIYSSSDGVSWQLITDNAEFGGRYGHKVISFEGKFWVVGGVIGGNQSDIWSSEDGVEWLEETETSGFTRRRGFELLEFGGRLWLVGGRLRDGEAGSATDILSSADALTWRREGSMPQAMFKQQFDTQLEFGFRSAFVFEDKFWIYSTCSFYSECAYVPFAMRNDIWRSEDGINWVRIEVSGPPQPHLRMLADRKKNRVWSLVPPTHGAANVPFYFSSPTEMWTSENGLAWQRNAETAEFLPRSRAALGKFNDTWWLRGGVGSSGSYQNEQGVWTSTTGLNWQFSSSPSAPGCPVSQPLILNDRLWWFGEPCFSEPPPVAVSPSPVAWVSDNAVDWTIQILNEAHPIRRLGGYAAFDGRLWMVGGIDGIGDSRVWHNDVWSSQDGINWTRVNESADFQARAGHRLLSFNNKLWLFGGSNSEETLYDIWSSEDGEQWQGVASAPPWSPLTNYSLVVHDGAMFVIGGTIDNPEATPESNPYAVICCLHRNSVWSSTDGVEWQEVTAEAPFEPRQFSSVISSDGLLWLFGGERYDFVPIDGQEPPATRIAPYADAWSSADGREWRRLLKAKIALP